MTTASDMATFWRSFWALYDSALNAGIVEHVPGPAPRSAMDRFPSTVLAVAADTYDITIHHIVGRSREAWLLEPRALAAWGMRNCGLPLSSTVIGRAMGGRDHTTILHLLRRADELRERSPRFRGACEDLRNHFTQLEETVQ